MKKLKDNDLGIETMINEYHSFQDKFISHLIDIEKQQILWFYQILTISGAIIGGFVLSKSDRNFIENLALTFLFIFTFTSFYILYYHHTIRAKNIKEGLKDLDRTYSITIPLKILSKKDNLSIKENEQYNFYLNEYKKLVKDSLKMEQLRIEEESEQHIALAPILVMGIFICILCLIFSNQIIDIIG
jgi:hypothetical protein